MDALLAAVTLLMLAGTAAFACTKAPRAATAFGAGGAVLACLIGLVPTLQVLFGGAPESLRLGWDAAHGPFCIGLDALSAFFLLPVLGLSGLAAVYGGNYMLAYRHEKALGSPWFFFNAFVAGMVLVVIARTAVAVPDGLGGDVDRRLLPGDVRARESCGSPGRVDLSHRHSSRRGVSVICRSCCSGAQAGGLEFAAFCRMPAFSAGWAGVIFVLALVGFGAKAGFVPFHVWLPEAHPAAPSHVSALMSGVMIKMGLYGMLRVLTFSGAAGPLVGTDAGRAGTAHGRGRHFAGPAISAT